MDLKTLRATLFELPEAPNYREAIGALVRMGYLHKEAKNDAHFKNSKHSRWSTNSDLAVKQVKNSGILAPRAMTKTKTFSMTYPAHYYEDTSFDFEELKELVFVGELEQFVLAFMDDLAKELQAVLEPGAESLSRILKELTRKHFPLKTFRSPMPGVYELVVSNVRLDKPIVVAVARLARSPLQFGYPSKRGVNAGEPAVIRSHRVNVVSQDETGFYGKHKRGLRRYNFAKMAWAAVEDFSELEVDHVPVLTIDSRGGYGEKTVLKLDHLRSRGE
jgi:hypothetical protein